MISINPGSMFEVGMSGPDEGAGWLPTGSSGEAESGSHGSNGNEVRKMTESIDAGSDEVCTGRDRGTFRFDPGELVAKYGGPFDGRGRKHNGLVIGIDRVGAVA